MNNKIFRWEIMSCKLLIFFDNKLLTLLLTTFYRSIVDSMILFYNIINTIKIFTTPITLLKEENTD